MTKRSIHSGDPSSRKQYWLILIILIILLGIALIISRYYPAPTSRLPANQSGQTACVSHGYSAKYYSTSVIPYKGSLSGIVRLDDASQIKFDTAKTKQGNQALVALQNLTCLEELGLWNTGGKMITDLTPLAKLTHLKLLYIDGTHITDLKPLSGLINLVQLSIAASPVTDLSPLQSLDNLRNLDICPRVQTGVPEIIIPSIAPLGQLDNLEYLTLCLDAPVNLSPLYDLKQLKELSVRGNWAGLNRDSVWFAPTKKTSYPAEIINLKKALPRLKIDFGEGGLVQNLPTNFNQ